MADFAAPPGPPPPKVPEGWVARWNDQYHEWFYVNTYTKKSQWDRPTEPAVDPNRHDDGAPPGPPPGYTPGSGPSPTDSKNNPFVNESTKPGYGSSSHVDEDADARLARQLQEEENARTRGAAQSYANTPTPPQGYSPYPDQLPPRSSGGSNPADKAKGLLGKFFGSGKNKPHAGYPGQQQYSPQPQQPYGGYGSPPPPQQGYYNGPPPPQQYGGYGPPPGQYGGYPPQGGYGGYPPQGGYYGQQQPPKKSGGGMGMAGGAALGVGAGLLGGALIADAINDEQQEAYAEGYQDGNGGGDYGGGDDFGGDF
ncbi:hypothetical protein F5Y00DRAFT_223347 [Daldinia vernicosa]|uniref:uncharacterized protein n=1 Tax=Daldinia vernicosa TaxID=114800 RepID=UPI0020084B7C|nr:uncharacterized protein F5Y00DRAFT_223347 [Daldinia vernicosa]KAI0853694.1 hypothetical protein F5Y00DRAFT_223347 [Daldinia vernicosa]